MTAAPRSNRKTGDLIERLAESLLVADRWLVHRTRRAKFDTNDLFGVFDLMAIAPHAGTMRFVQTTTDANAPHRKRKVEDWARPFYDPETWREGPTMEVWAYGEWPDGTGFRMWTYRGGREWMRSRATRAALLPP